MNKVASAKTSVKTLVFLQKRMPRGRPPKSKRGQTTTEDLDPKLSTKRRRLKLMKGRETLKFKN